MDTCWLHSDEFMDEFGLDLDIVAEAMSTKQQKSKEELLGELLDATKNPDGQAVLEALVESVVRPFRRAVRRAMYDKLAELHTNAKNARSPRPTTTSSVRASPRLAARPERSSRSASPTQAPASAAPIIAPVAYPASPVPPSSSARGTPGSAPGRLRAAGPRSSMYRTSPTNKSWRSSRHHSGR